MELETNICQISWQYRITTDKRNSRHPPADWPGKDKTNQILWSQDNNRVDKVYKKPSHWIFHDTYSSVKRPCITYGYSCKRTNRVVEITTATIRESHFGELCLDQTTTLLNLTQWWSLTVMNIICAVMCTACNETKMLEKGKDSSLKFKFFTVQWREKDTDKFWFGWCISACVLESVFNKTIKVTWSIFHEKICI